jgi:hypothetical protein
VIVHFVDICGIVNNDCLEVIAPLNSDGQQFHQYQQSEQSHLNSRGQQFHQYQQSEQSPLSSRDQQFTNINKVNNDL